MTDDIVTRLRKTVDRRTSLVSNGISRVRAETQLMIEAADEIERLRADLVQANNQIKLLIAIETAGGRQEDGND